MSRIKLFPLNLVSFPTKIVHLHIFEERYKNLIRNCIDHKSEFGIIYKSNDALAEFGCSMNITKVVKKYSDGRMDIVTEGKKIFKLNSQLLDGDLLIGDVNFSKININKSLKNFESIKDKYLKILLMLDITSNLDTHLKKTTSFELLEGISLPAEFELMLISTTAESDRIKILDGIFNKILKNQFPIPSGSNFQS